MSDRPRQWNSTLPIPKKPLQRKTPLRSRSLTEKYGDDPIRYGVLFREVRKMPCAGKVHAPRHVCSGRHTAHHDPPVGKRGDDLSGMIPCCDRLHAKLENRQPVFSGGEGQTRSMLLEELGWDEARLAEVAMGYVQAAIRRLEAGDGLPEEVAEVARERGYEVAA